MLKFIKFILVKIFVSSYKILTGLHKSLGLHLTNCIIACL